jgi:hypothetical protein
MTWLLSLAGNWRAWAAVGIALLGLALYVQTVRLDGCQGALEGARAKLAVLGAQIEAQNAAVVSLELEGRARVAEAARALANAREKAEVLHGQLRRFSEVLKAAEERPEITQASACPAGDAVQEVRRALAR